MVKRLCLVVCTVIFGAVLASGQTSTSPTVAAKTAFSSQVELKNKVIEMFDSLGTDPTAKYDVIVVTITHFKQTKQTAIDSASIKLSNTGISATEVTSGKTTKEIITLRSGKIGDKTINNMEIGASSSTPILTKVQIGTGNYPTSTNAGSRASQ